YGPTLDFHSIPTRRSSDLTAWAISFVTHSVTFAFGDPVPVGRTIRKRSKKASSIGPWRPERLARPGRSGTSTSVQRPSAFHKCQDRKSTRLNSSHQIIPYA